MNRNRPLDPRIVTLLGEALQPLLRKVEARLSEPARSMDTAEDTEDDAKAGFLDAARGFLDAAESFADVAQRTLGRYGDSMERLCTEVNDVIGRVTGTGDVSADVHRAVGRFEVVLDELLDAYVEVREVRPGRDQERGRDLLTAALRHTLTEVQSWLQDVVDSAADPMEAVKRKGVPTDGTDGRINMELMLSLTTPTALEEFDDWVSEQEREVEELDRSLEARRAGGGPGCAAGLAALVAGIFLGGWFFGGDDE